MDLAFEDMHDQFWPLIEDAAGFLEFMVETVPLRNTIQNLFVPVLNMFISAQTYPGILVRRRGRRPHTHHRCSLIKRLCHEGDLGIFL
jgi:hypothetical protein